MSVSQFHATVSRLIPRERVMTEFNAGKIGFRWIVKYFVAWFKFKLKKIIK